MSQQSSEMQVFSAPVNEAAQGERAALRAAEQCMLQVEQRFADWFAAYEDAQPDTAPRSEVVELMASAPTDFARGLIYGKYLMRLEIAAITKRPWI